jgi:hypothetical protein
VTTTRLKVEAVVDTTVYEKGIRITTAEMKRLNIPGQAFHPEWNCTVRAKCSIERGCQHRPAGGTIPVVIR